MGGRLGAARVTARLTSLAVALSIGLAVAALPAVTACSAPAEPSRLVADQSYVSGPGTVTKIAPDERGSPIDLAGTLLDGGGFDVANHRGKVVVLNVWGSWCPPCRAEAPGLQRVWTAVRGKGVQFVGIDTRDTKAAAQAFERRFGLTYPSISDEDGELLLAFRTTLPPNAIPSTIVLDRQGRVAARIVGATTEEKLRRLIDDVLAEKA
jgi:peroxiredoxin